MYNKLEHSVLRSIGAGFGGMRNVGNIRSDEIEITEKLIKEKLIKISIHKDSEWYELTNKGQEKLYRLNGSTMMKSSWR
jgi:hypothetical protein